MRVEDRPGVHPGTGTPPAPVVVMFDVHDFYELRSTPDCQPERPIVTDVQAEDLTLRIQRATVLLHRARGYKDSPTETQALIMQAIDVLQGHV